MTRTIALQARIEDDGRMYVMAGSQEVIGLYHLLHPTDPLGKALTTCLAMNDAARGKGPKPDCDGAAGVPDSG
jgi:hypothetical protein